ncbi:class I SAM-dependent methyltransferase [Mycolicibacterium sphagni]|uniref:class I SAM-dependent methyltransferase n=1 Tax=Mycolicibacterium sphagni TaxID=1786 RepID=UPI0021F386B8|nr:class I SAM-dependent methyltransferase [Mycolicibacterium sphagni]MCV7177490.1 hypothetical protein [Mycolicibacterium sphagni]
MSGPVTRRFWNRFAMLRAACYTAMTRTNVRYWTSIASGGPPPWDERNRIIAQFVKSGTSVLDLGAGARTLKGHLSPDCRYQPCDIVRSPEVWFCDFNSGVYPPVHEKFDYVICSGVLEYIWKPLPFIERITEFGSTTLMSYNPLTSEQKKLDRLANLWVNHLPQQELEELFQSLDLQYELIDQRPSNELLYQISSPNQKTVAGTDVPHGGPSVS